MMSAEWRPDFDDATTVAEYCKRISTTTPERRQTARAPHGKRDCFHDVLPVNNYFARSEGARARNARERLKCERRGAIDGNFDST